MAVDGEPVGVPLLDSGRFTHYAETEAGAIGPLSSTSAQLSYERAGLHVTGRSDMLQHVLIMIRAVDGILADHSPLKVSKVTSRSQREWRNLIRRTHEPSQS